jgi:hypothetical protein
MRQLLHAVIAAGITGLCLWFLLTPQVLTALARVACEANPAALAAAFLLSGGVQWLRAWRFQVMSTGRLGPPEWPMIRIALQLNFLNFVLPFRLGELGYPALMRQQYGHAIVRSAGVLLIARLFDLTTVLAILLGSAAVLQPAAAGQTALMIGALGFAVAPFALVRLGTALWPRLAALAGAGAAPLATLPSLGQGPTRVVVGLGFGIWLLFGLIAMCVAQAVVATVSPGAAMLGAAAGNLAFALPVNGVAGIGPAQAAWVLATTWVGVPHDDAIVSALALHAVVLLSALVFGGLATASGPGRRRALPGRPGTP